jgi:hypothetical protein
MNGPRSVKRYALPFDIHINVSDGHTSLSSRLHEQLVEDSPERDDAGMVAVHTFEALLLAMAHRGVDLGSDEVALAVIDAVEAVAQYL